MKGLWTKDIKLISSQQKSLLAIWLIAAGILITTDQISFAISYTSIITSMIGVSTITYDAFDNGNVFLFTLPFTRKEYAMEKYLFTLFLGAVATIGGILLVIVVMMAKGAFSVNAEEILITVLINIPSLLIFQAIFLPVQLKYEGEKGRIVVIGAVIVIVVFLFRMLEMAGIDLLDIILNHMYLKDTTLWVSTYIISIVVRLLSFIISERIVLKKEF